MGYQAYEIFIFISSVLMCLLYVIRCGCVAVTLKGFFFSFFLSKVNLRASEFSRQCQETEQFSIRARNLFYRLTGVTPCPGWVVVVVVILIKATANN